LRVWTGARKSLLVSGRSSGRCNYVPRDELGSLVDELVEGVLTVGTTLSPDDGLLCQSWSAQVRGRLTPVS
jgi:hypothetical protein